MNDSDPRDIWDSMLAAAPIPTASTDASAGEREVARILGGAIVRNGYAALRPEPASPSLGGVDAGEDVRSLVMESAREHFGLPTPAASTGALVEAANGIFAKRWFFVDAETYADDPTLEPIETDEPRRFAEQALDTLTQVQSAEGGS